MKHLVSVVVSGAACALLAAGDPQSSSNVAGRLERGQDRCAAGDFAAAAREYAPVGEAPDAPAEVRSLAALRLAECQWQVGDKRSARATLAAVAGMDGAPAHHREEARARLAGLDRGQKSSLAAGSVPGRTRATVAVRAGLTLHVASDGAAGNPGTRRSPFGSLEQARNAIRALKHRAGLPKGGIEVLVHGGRYAVANTLILTADDSGTPESPIVYRAVRKERPVFTGGVRLHGFAPLSNAAVRTRLPEVARAAVVEVDLRAHGVTNLWPLELGGFSSGRGFHTHPAMELFFDGEALPLAGGPEEGWLQVAEVSEPGAPAPGSNTGSRVGRFKYGGDRPARWTDEPELWLFGYWFWDWADSYERVSGVDVERREITLAPPYHTYGYRAGQRFRAVNALSELDRPGEWYLDRARQRLYVWPPSDPSRAVVELSTVRSAFVTLQGVSDVSFEGLTWELGCADGIRIEGGQRCRLAGCTIRHFAGQGVGIEGGNEHRLVSCDIYSLGRGGIALVGGDRKTLTPSGHRVENCHVYDLSRIDHTYTPAVWCGGVGHRLAHNWFHDIRSSAIRLDANDCLVEWNEICRVVLESDDQGAVDMFGDPTFRGNVYRFNYFHHVGSRWATGQEPALGQAGIRLDDAISGTLIYANIFYRVGGGGHGFGGVQIHGGKDNILDHNLFVDCPFAVSFSPWGDGRWRQFVQNSLASPSIDRGLYAARYPALARLPEDHDVNGIWRNRAIGCGELFHHNASRNRVWDNLVVTNSWDWQGTAPGDFGRLPADDRARRWDLPGAAFSRVGLYPDTWRPQAPTAAIRRVRETGQSALPLLRRP